jgi:hypothetical protein
VLTDSIVVSSVEGLASIPSLTVRVPGRSRALGTLTVREGMRNSTASLHKRFMVYLITFCSYGSRVPGDEGWISRKNNLVGARHKAPSETLARISREAMAGARYHLDSERRQIVLQTIIGVCQHRSWTLFAAHVRTTHVHTVVDAVVPPERIANDFKSYASRALKGEQRKWARHGSALYLRSPDAVANALCYVIEEQGESMAVYSGNQSAAGAVC